MEEVRKHFEDLMKRMVEENWKVEFVDPKELKIAPTNVRTSDISEADKDIMDSSVGSIGIKEPLIINENNEIVSGGLRWRSALRVGLPLVPVIRKRFSSKFEERITCMLQDDCHHPLTDRDRYEFVKKCMEEDGKTIDEIAAALGKSPATILQWTKYEVIPEQIKQDQRLISDFLEIERRKRLKLISISNTKYFKENPGEYLKLVENESLITLSMLEEINKAASAGLSIDVDFILELSKISCILMKCRVPTGVVAKFYKRLNEEKKDYFKVVCELIRGFAVGSINV